MLVIAKEKDYWVWSCLNKHGGILEELTHGLFEAERELFKRNFVAHFTKHYMCYPFQGQGSNLSVANI